MKIKSVYCILLLLSACFGEPSQQKITLEDIQHVISGLSLKHPLILKEKSSSSINLIKELSQNLQYSKLNLPEDFKAKSHTFTTMLLARNSNETFELSKHIAKVKSLFIILANADAFEFIMNNLNVEIDQKVFVVKIPSLEVFETYVINEHKIKRRLGRISVDSSRLIWDPSLEKNLIKRRFDFYGKQLKVMTEEYKPTVVFDPSYKKLAPYYPQNETYLVNGFISGIHYDILTALQNQLNFTTRIYKREDGIWGFVQKHSNETYTASGMVGDLFYQNADLIVADLTFNLDRNIFIDFTIYINPDDYGLYIMSHFEAMELDYDLFLAPFTLELWIMISIIVILISSANTIIIQKFCSGSSSSVIEILLNVFSALVFGGKFPKTLIDDKKSYRLITLISMLGGLVIWIAYRSFLSAELAIVIKKYPLHDLESLSKTKFRYKG